MTRGESLAAVAARINDQTAATGVVASVTGDDLQLASDTQGAAATVRVDAIQPAYDQSVAGVNGAQIGDFTVISLADGSEHVLSGQVTRTASALALQGGTGAVVVDSATFQLTGSQGTATIAITAGESLAAVASRVNDLSGSTGVSAQVSGNQLQLTSTELGSAASVEVELIHVHHTTTVSGVNSQQLTAFQVDQFTDGASQTLSGSVTQTAGLAELTFKGNVLQLVGTNATFTLSGSLGSVQISTTARSRRLPTWPRRSTCTRLPPESPPAFKAGTSGSVASASAARLRLQFRSPRARSTSRGEMAMGPPMEPTASP